MRKLLVKDRKSSEWVYITDPELINFEIMLAALKAEPREMPFFANYGVEAQDSVMSRTMPDYWMIRTQEQFAKNFKSLSIVRDPAVEFGYVVAVTLSNKEVIKEWVK